MDKKIKSLHDKEIIYSEDQWEIFKNFRDKTEKVMNLFQNQMIEVFTYGSIARGDVKKTSDIDIIITRKIPSYRIELILDECPFRIITRKIIQATPNSEIKVYYELEEEITIVANLTIISPLGSEFHKFGGAINYPQLKNDLRVPGINKQLLLIQPTENGHIESSILDKSDQNHNLSGLLGVSQELIKQRIRVLKKRDNVGRTGVFMERELHSDENVEEILKQIATNNSVVRRKLRQ